jgi:hypothetical protein
LWAIVPWAASAQIILIFRNAEILKRKGGIFLKSAGNIPLGRMGIFKIKRHVLN